MKYSCLSRFSALCLIVLSLSLPFRVRAAVVNFSAPANYAADTDVASGGGNQLFAWTWGGSTTVNGVAFTGTIVNNGAVGPYLTLSSFTGNNATVFTANAAPFNALSGSYSNMVRGSVFNGTAGTTATATLNNLVVGHTYLVQIWASDPRAGASTNRVVDVSSSGPSVRLQFNSTLAAGGVGQTTRATFVADSTTQIITFDGSAVTSPWTGIPQINAMQLRDVTAVWSGTTSGTWADSDTTSQNFSGTNYAGVKAVSTDVYFGDTDASGNPVATSTIAVGAGGASGANANFNNSSVAYTLNSADATGIAGAIGVNVIGSGTVTLNGANTYTGNTTISGSTLAVGNSAAISSSAAIVLTAGTVDASALTSLSLASGRTLSGFGTIKGSVDAASGSAIVPGGVANAGTITITNNLSLNGQTMTFDMGFAPGNGDKILIGNVLTVNSTCTLSLNYLQGALAGGTYTLMTFASKAGAGTFVLDTTYPGVTLNVNPTSVTLTVGGGGGTSSTWTNLLGGAWAGATNWAGSTIASNVDGVADFSTLNITAARTVTINGTKTIGHLVFADTVQDNNWTLSTGTNILSVSSGSPKIIVNNGQNTTISATLAGTQGFTKLGAGTLTLSGSNSLAGGVSVMGGALNVNSAGALGNTVVSTVNPVLLSNAAVTFSTASPAKNFTNNFVFAGTSNAIVQASAAQDVIVGSFSGSGTVNISTPSTIVTAQRGDMSGFSGTILVSGNAAGNNAGGFLMGQGDTTTFVSGSSNAVFDYEGNTLNYLYNGSLAGSSATVYMGALVGNNANVVLNGKNSLGSAVGDVTIEEGALNTSTLFAGTLKDYAGTTPGTPAPKLGLRKVGSGALTLTGTAANTGPTEVRKGRLTIQGSLAAPVTVFSGATFELSGSLGSGAVTVNSGATFLVDNGGNLGTAAVQVDGSMDVTAFGGGFSLGTASLSGSGAVSGGVTLASTTINPGQVGGAATLAMNGGDLTVNGGTLAFDLSNDPTNGVNDQLVVNGNLNVNSAATVSINKLTGSLGGGNYALLKFTGSLSGSLANLALVGAGPLDILQQNGQEIDLVVSPVTSVTWTGGTAGNLWDILTSPNWLLNSTHTTYSNGEAVVFSDIGATNPVVTIPATVAPVVVFVSSVSNYTFTGAADISDGATLSKNGAGTLTIVNTNTYAGSTIVNGGALKLGDGLTMNGSVAGNISDNATLVFANPLDQAYSGAISGAGSLIKQGAGTLILTATNLLTGPTTISAGALALGDGTSLNGLLGNGPVTNNSLLLLEESQSATVSNNITGTGAVDNVGVGDLILKGFLSGNCSLTNDSAAGKLYLQSSNSYSGGTWINGGIVIVNDAALRGLGSGPVVINDGSGALQIGTFGSNVLANAVQLPPNSTTEQFTMLSVNAGFVTVRATNVLSGGAPAQITRLVNTSVAGNNRATLILDNSANNFTTIPETYSGTLAFTSDGALGSVNNGISVNCAAHVNTTFFNRADDGLRFDANNITLNPNRTINLVGASENINVQAYNGIIAGPVTGLGMTKLGSGTLTLNGPGSLTGTTTVTAGTLLINNSWSGTLVSVASGATLGGSGALGGSAQVLGALSPGNSIGTLSISNSLTLGTASTTTMELNAGTLACDKVIGMTTVTFSGTLNVVNLGGTLAAGQSYQLFSASTYAGNFTATNLPALTGGLTWNWNPANGTLSVNSPVNTNPTNITAVVSGGNLNLSWPADHTGWRLQAQTNAPSLGLTTNWATVPGSTTVNSMSFPINTANGSVFFRLVYP